MPEACPVGAADLANSGWQVVIRKFTGSPLCYWQAQMAADKVRFRPNLVVLAFYGNFGTGQASQACTQGRGDLTSVYTEDAAKAATIWAGTATLWVSPPASVGSAGGKPGRPPFLQPAARARRPPHARGWALGADTRALAGARPGVVSENPAPWRA